LSQGENRLGGGIVPSGIGRAAASPAHHAARHPWLINDAALSNPRRRLGALIVTIPTVYAYPAAQ